MRLAYPDGPAAIPEEKRVYYDLPRDRPVDDFLRDLPVARKVCQVIPAQEGGSRGYALRLGCAHFPHLKLKLQLVDYNNSTVWIFMVDTHDKLLSVPADHPDYEKIQGIKVANLRLKERIERALEQDGLMTFSSLLRNDLDRAAAP
jgi:hypothetical protein